METPPRRPRTDSLKELWQKVESAKQDDNVYRFIQLYLKYREEWSQCSNADDFIPPPYSVNNIPYSPLCSRLILKLEGKTFVNEEGLRDIDTAKLSPDTVRRVGLRTGSN